MGSAAPAAINDLPAEQAAHLSTVLDRQPAVLTRVGQHGTLLAVNDAGLALLGAKALEQVLGTSLLDMVEPEQRGACGEFIDRALNGTRGSFEADVTGLTGARYKLEFHATAHPGAPDGIVSALISFRNVTEVRRLEQSLVEAGASQSEHEARLESERKRLEDAQAELAALQEAHATELTTLRTAHEAEQATTNAALRELQARYDTDTGALRTALNDAMADHARLAEAAAAAERDLEAAHAARLEVEHRHGQLQAAVERFVEEAAVSSVPRAVAPPAAATPTTTVQSLASKLGTELPRRLGDWFDLTMLSTSVDGSIAVDESMILASIGAFADSRRASMLSGQATVEISETTLDDAAARQRGISAGPYVVVALQINGPGAQQSFPQEVFDSADHRAWQGAKEELQAARASIVSAGGQVWLSPESASVVSIAFYLPCDGSR